MLANEHSTSLPAPTEVQAILGELIAQWDGFPSSVLIGARENITIGLTVFGLTAHVYTLADAALTLHQVGKAMAAVPLIRAALEHSVTAVWVELAGYSGALALIHEQTRGQKNTMSAWVESGMPDDHDIVKRLTDELGTSLKTSTGAGQKFEQRCREIEGGLSMYALYRSASQVCHPTTSVVDLYLGEASVDDPGPGGVALSTVPAEYSPDAWLNYALVAVVQATSAWSRLDSNHTHRRAMKELNRRLGTRQHQAFTADGLKMQRRREAELKTWLAQDAAGAPPAG